MWSVRCRHLEPIITGLKFTTTATPDATVVKGSNDFPTISRSAAGKVVATLKETGLFARGPIVIVTPGEDIAAGGFGCYDTDPSVANSQLTAELLGAAGSGDDGSGHVIALGFGSTDTDRFDDSQNVRSTVNDPRLMGWLIANNGTATKSSGGAQASIERLSQGIVKFTLGLAMANYRAFGAIAINAASRRPKITAGDGESITVAFYDSSGVAQDTDFVLVGLFSGLSEEGGRVLDIVRVPQLYPELVVGKVTQDTGTYSISIGGATNGEDFTITKNGTGDVSVDLVRAAGRVIIPIASAKDNQCQLLATPDLDTARFGIFNASDVATDDDFNFIILQYETGTDQEF